MFHKAAACYSDNICLSRNCSDTLCAEATGMDDNEICFENSECISNACGYDAFNVNASKVCCASGDRFGSYVYQSDGWPIDESYEYLFSVEENRHTVILAFKTACVHQIFAETTSVGTLIDPLARTAAAGMSYAQVSHAEMVYVSTLINL